MDRSALVCEARDFRAAPWAWWWAGRVRVDNPRAPATGPLFSDTSGRREREREIPATLIADSRVQPNGDKMSYMLQHLHNGWQVDQAILSEEDRIVVIRFGHDWDPTCMKMDEVLLSIAEKVKNFAVIYLVDTTEVPDFNRMYELYDPCTVMFFFRNKHIMVDLGTGNNNKINWALDNTQEMIDIIETVYRGARKGRGLVESPKDYSTRYRY